MAATTFHVAINTRLSSNTFLAVPLPTQYNTSSFHTDIFVWEQCITVLLPVYDVSFCLKTTHQSFDFSYDDDIRLDYDIARRLAEIVDTTGAGDVFNTEVLYSLGTELPQESILRPAFEVGSAKLSVSGWMIELNFILQ